MIGTVLWEEMAREMFLQDLPQPLWTWSWTGCWARCHGRYVGVGGEAVSYVLGHLPVYPTLPQQLTLLLPSLLQEFFLQRNRPVLQPLALTPRLSVRQALERVLRLPAVASKRYLTNKVLPKHLPCSSDLCSLPSAHPHLASHPWGLLWEPTSLKGEVAKAGQPCDSLVPCCPPSE